MQPSPLESFLRDNGETILASVIGGVLLFLLTELIRRLLRRRRKDKPTLQAEKIAKLNKKISLYEGWYNNKVDYLLWELANLAYTFFIITLVAVSVLVMTGLGFLVSISSDVPPPETTLVIDRGLRVLVLVGGILAIFFVSAGMFARLRHVTNFERYKQQLEDEINEIK